MPPTVIGNKQPLYRQVAQLVRQRIRTQQYNRDQPLPSFRAMAQEFEVSLCVIQRAIHTLEADGVLTSHHGKAVVVEQKNASERAAIVFGMIQPFKTGMRLRVLHYAEQAFSERDNFVITRNSEGEAAAERHIAEHLVANGVSGLLIWPVEQSPNGPFFQKLSKKLPVVLVDRRVAGANLPVIEHATEAGGRDICKYLLDKKQSQKMVALIDEGHFSAYDDLMAGLVEQARQMKRKKSLQILRWPLVKIVEQFAQSDFSAVDIYAQKLAALFEEGADSLFCPQSDFIDTVLIQTGLSQQYTLSAVGTIDDPLFNQHTRSYCESGIVKWQGNHAMAIRQGADLLEQWITTRQCPNKIEPIAIKRVC